MNMLALAAGLAVARLVPVRLSAAELANDAGERVAPRGCKRCGIGDWHPEARSCTATDCELRRSA